MTVNTTKWVCDADNVREVYSEVSDSLAAILNDQRQKLDQVDAKRPGVERYEMARQAGCFAAVAKGARYRILTPEQIFIPRTEFRVTNGQLRIPVLKATLSVPANMHVKAIMFRRDNPTLPTTWYGVLEVVVEQKQAAAAAA